MTRRIAALALAVFATTPTLLADTLVLTNGRRMLGELVGVYGRDIEFEERSGWNRRVVRIPRHEITRIEFDTGSPLGRDRDDIFGGGIPRGMRERQVSVTAREPWTDTGIDTRAGQMIYFSSTGETRWGRERRDGAAGEKNSPWNPNRPLPDRPAAALIARIGEADMIFVGADAGPFRTRSSGRLYLGINDDVFEDNTGSLRVTISY